MKLIRTLFAFSIFCAFLFFLSHLISEYLTQIADYGLYPSFSEAMITLLVSVLWGFMIAVSWEWILRKVCTLEKPLSKIYSMQILFHSLLAKYIPGKVWQFFNRVDMLEKQNVPIKTSVTAIFYEQCHYFIATITIFFLTLPLYVDFFVGHFGRIFVFLFILLGATLVIIWSFFPLKLLVIFNKLIHKITTGKVTEPLILHKSSFAWQITSLLYLAVVIIQAGTVFPIAQFVLPETATLTLPEWIMVLAAYPTARLCGQMSFIFPGGFGVREGIYILMVMPIVGMGPATIIGLWARIAQISGEVSLWILSRFLCMISGKKYV